MTKTETSPARRQRIAKLMARAGLCSRRDAETWIVDGRVSVNGTVLTSPALDVALDDSILVDGVPLPAAEKTRLFLFHKPRGLVTSDRDPEGRETVADYLRENWPDGPRVVTIGRLDINTEGLLLLTNDGGLARVLELPQTGWLRRYRVRAKGAANPAALEALANGLTIDGIEYAGIEAKLDRVQGSNSWLTMGLREGKNREIKRVLEHLGLEVNRLIRLSFGPFQLLDLPEGAVEEVRTRVLRDQLGQSLITQADVDFGDAATTPIPVRNEDKSREKPTGLDGSQKGRRAPPTEQDRLARVSRPPARHGSTRPPNRRAAERLDRSAEKDDAPKRERPAGGTRKHVSTLRATKSEAARKGPRRRIERTDTRDRRDRAVSVERLVSTRPTPVSANDRTHRISPEKADRRDPDRRVPRQRNQDPERSDDRRRNTGMDGPRRSARADGPRRHASPSAQGKRERISRSGEPRDRGQDQHTGNTRKDERPRRDYRPARSGRPDKGSKRNTPREDRRPGRDEKRENRLSAGAARRSENTRQSRSHRENEPSRDTRAKTGRPMSAAARKPGSRKPSGSGRPAGGRPRGPSKPAH